MSVESAREIYRRFHLKEPDRLVELHSYIPRFVYPIGFGIQLSYRSNKWNKNDKYIDYIHHWEHETLVCVPRSEKDLRINGFVDTDKVDIGKNREEVTFLGYAIDFSISPVNITSEVSETNSGDSVEFSGERNSLSRLMSGSTLFPFNPDPIDSSDYVVSSPNGHIVYVISEDERALFAFINKKCVVTGHGIEG